jgi:hypothetical protein
VIKLQIRWPNAKHELLQGRNFTLSKGENQTVEPVSEAPGLVTYDLDDDITQFELTLMFIPELPMHNKAKDIQPILLWDAIQTFRVENNVLIPDTGRVGLLTRSEEWTAPLHPLIDLVSIDMAVSGIAVLELRTEFVDITEWVRAVSGTFWPYFMADNPAGNRLAFLAATKADPPVWIVHCQDDMAPAKPETDALVFYRPGQHNPYTKAISRANTSLLWFSARYLFAPSGDANVTTDKGDMPSLEERTDKMTRTFHPLRASMMDAVIRSGRKVVAIHPWPTASVIMGDAGDARLPRRCDEILRFMQGRGMIGAGQDNLRLGRLGIAGYSQGGDALYPALQANRTRVSELYLFDPNNTKLYAPYVIDWARKTRNFRLRMITSLHWVSMAATRRTLLGAMTGEAGDLFMSLHPPNPATYWKSLAEGGDPAWNRVTEGSGIDLGAWPARHQFAMFGGELDDGHPFMRTWLEIFLDGSGFEQ